MKKERDPTREEFDRFLLWLAPDRDDAGQKLKLIHFRLTQIFASRGCVDAESLGDEVINRVAVRIDSVVHKYSDPLPCCMGFVNNVYREYLREQIKRATARASPPPRPSEELEKEDDCLKECLEDLPASERDLVVRYFRGEKGANKSSGRKKLATELKLTANALRILAHRLRKKVLQCLQKCLEQT